MGPATVVYVAGDSKQLNRPATAAAAMFAAYQLPDSRACHAAARTGAAAPAAAPATAQRTHPRQEAAEAVKQVGMARQQQAHALHHPRLVQQPLMALPQRRHEAEGSRGKGRAGGWLV